MSESAENSNEIYSRSPHLLHKTRSTLLVIDLQEKLVPSIRGHQKLIWNTRRLVDGAGILEVPVVATEQYPRGLGPTVAEIGDKLDSIPEKSMFSCRECSSIIEHARDTNRHQMVLTGIETHVCVLQTALDFVAAGLDVFLVTDATGSRFRKDQRIAIQRMQSQGINLITTESVLFEWCEVSGTPEFKKISELVKEDGPHGISEQDAGRHSSRT